MTTFGSIGFQESLGRLPGSGAIYPPGVFSTASFSLPPELDVSEPLVPYKYVVSYINVLYLTNCF